MRELERRFPPEFRNRIDEVVLFSPLTHDEVREIAKHYLDQVTLTLAKTGKTMKVESEALELVVQKGYNMAFGARFLKRYIDEHIKLPISARWKEGTHFEVRAVDGAIVVEPGLAKVTSPAEALIFGDVA
jgi:ATP-dependent Clp protease ATP-binding subunit ClpA